jgi:hypothetical protein
VKKLLLDARRLARSSDSSCMRSWFRLCMTQQQRAAAAAAAGGIKHRVCVTRMEFLHHHLHESAVKHPEDTKHLGRHVSAMHRAQSVLKVAAAKKVCCSSPAAAFSRLTVPVTEEARPSHMAQHAARGTVSPAAFPQCPAE